MKKESVWLNEVSQSTYIACTNNEHKIDHEQLTIDYYKIFYNGNHDFSHVALLSIFHGEGCIIHVHMQWANLLQLSSLLEVTF